MRISSLAGTTFALRYNAIMKITRGVLVASICLIALSPTAKAQSDAAPIMVADMDMPMSTPKNMPDAKDLADELKALRKQVSELQSAMEQQGPRKGMKGKRMARKGMGMTPGAGRMPAMGAAPAMAMEDDMEAMLGSGTGSPMAMDSMEMGSMGGANAAMPGVSGSSMSSGMNAMGCCMGEMGSMAAGGAMQPATSLPGFPGRSHLYHIGAEGFYLNHLQHIVLSLEQQTRLNQLREKAALEEATFSRKIAEGEQQMFVLTGADQPDAAKIEAQLRNVESLRVQQRMAFIRAVGDAAQVLTDQQRDLLLGKSAPPEPKKM